MPAAAGQTTPKSQLVTVQRETDLSLLYRVLRTVIKPLRPRLVKPGKPEPAGSPRLANHPKRKNGCKIVERCHDRTDTWLYDFVPETSSSFVRKQGPGPLHNVYYFAGGGFQSPPSGQHWSFVGKIASSLAGTHRFTIVSYPLAPNSPASESLPVLRQLLTRLVSESATAGKKVVLMGDSAGGNVALSLAFWWATHLSKTIDAYSRKTSFGLGPIETGKPLDLEADVTRLRSVLESVVVISPASDLRNSNSQMAALDPHDPLLGSEYTGAVAEAWTASPPGELDTGINADDPQVSPALNSGVAYRALALQKIHVYGVYGTHDVLAPDTDVLRENCEKHGVKGSWMIWEGQMHCFPLAGIYGMEEGVKGMGWLIRMLREETKIEHNHLVGDRPLTQIRERPRLSGRGRQHSV
ncbi:esterase lipase protein [Apiospora aurea]|uniref:Esterase lipase protein n=1 Tax=Apiospora aurea TaxID=335848 RepID=A0ABR1QJG2_9PEZI